MICTHIVTCCEYKQHIEGYWSINNALVLTGQWLAYSTNFINIYFSIQCELKGEFKVTLDLRIVQLID